MASLRLSTEVLLVGLGSPAHHTLWNDLSCDTLAGDLRGHYGQEVSVRVIRVATLAESSSLLARLESAAPQLIGLSMQPGSLVLADFLMEGITARYQDENGPLVVLGNQIPTYFATEMLERYGEYRRLIVVKGEGEATLRSIVSHIRGEQSLASIKSIAYNDAQLGRTVETEWVTPPLDSLMYPPAIDTSYAVSRSGGNALIQASRGCDWGRCSYCTRTSFRNGKGWEGFPVDRVAATLAALVEIGIDEFEFCDDEFFGGRCDESIARVRGLIAVMRGLSSPITFRIFTRPDAIYRPGDETTNRLMLDLLNELQEVGLTRVYLGIESGCPSQLKRYSKGVTVEQCERAIACIRELGLGLDIGFIMFDPEVTLDEMMENLAFFERNGLKAHNQWPFRALVLNEGCSLRHGLQQSNLTVGAVDIDHVCYKYVYKDLRVQYIIDIIAQLSPPDGPYARLVYALKVLSKRYFAQQKKTPETRKAQEYIEEHCEIFLRLMAQLGKALRNAPKEATDGTKAAVDSAIAAMNRLIDRIGKSVNDSVIRDRDAYLTEQIHNLSPGSQGTEKVERKR